MPRGDNKMAFMEKFTNVYSDWGYLVARVVFGFFFAMAGAGKMGLLGKEAQTGFMLFIGVSELLIGLGVLFGVLSRIAALGGIVIMLGALTTVHMPWGGMQSFMSGQTAWLFLAAFLVVLAYGNGKYSLENAVLKKEIA